MKNKNVETTAFATCYTITERIELTLGILIGYINSLATLFKFGQNYLNFLHWQYCDKTQP